MKGKNSHSVRYQNTATNIIYDENITVLCVRARVCVCVCVCVYGFKHNAAAQNT